VPVDEPLQCRLDLDALLAGQKGVRQMKEHVAVDHPLPTPLTGARAPIWRSARQGCPAE
jgi:hypothetical protein